MNIACPKPSIGAVRPTRDALDTATNPAILRAALSDTLGYRVRALHVERVHFPKSRAIQIHYRFEAGRARVGPTLIGEWLGDDASGHCARETRRIANTFLASPGMSGCAGMFALDSLGIVLRRPGLDARLPGLRLLHDPAFAADFLARIFGLAARGASVAVELKAHRLGKRAVLFARFAPERGTARECYIRLHPTTHDGGRIAFETNQRIASAVQKSQVLRIPRTHRFDDQLGAAVISVLPGRPPAMTSSCDVTLAGHALTEWRRLEAPHGASWTALDEIGGLKAWVQRIGTYRERLAESFEAALERVSAELYCLPSAALVLGHRDFHEGQLLVDAGRCGLIDFDTCMNAPPALDAGNFLAHIRLRALRTGEDVNFAEDAFRSACDGLAGTAKRHIDTWTRAALLRLAAIYAFTSERQNVVAGLSAEASP